IAFYAALEKCVVSLTAAVHHYRTGALFAAAHQQERLLLMEVLCHLIQEIEGEAVNMHKLFFVRKNEAVGRVLFLDKFSRPTQRNVRIDILRIFNPGTPLAYGAVGIMDDLKFFDDMNDASF